MSDTPRTDAVDSLRETESNFLHYRNILKHAQILERELNAAVKISVTTAANLHEVCNELRRERDEARECLREILGGFGVCGCHVPALYATGIRSQIEIDRWRKAAGMEEQ
jgi:hypothetical protein